jgi:hypothetical protein
MTTLPRPPKVPSRAVRRAMREKLRAQAKASVAAYQSQPQVAAAIAKRKRKQRQRRLFLLLLLLLLLLLIRCECEEEPALPPVVDIDDDPEPEVKKKPSAKKRRKPKAKLEGEIDGSDRDEMQIEQLGPPSWLPQFRLQVAARSPRLAACFIGSEKPGALRWSALVHAQSGRVTESEIEPVFRGSGIDNRQHACLVKGLTEPKFLLDEPDPDAAARRVSLIFEF